MKNLKLLSMLFLVSIAVTSSSFGMDEVLLDDIFQEEVIDEKELGEKLIRACINGNVSTVKLLIEKGADLGAKDIIGSTPLLHASVDGSIDLIKLLIEKGEKKYINVPNKYGMTPLLYACRTNNLKLVKILLVNGAIINVQNKKGMTPLLYAYILGDLKFAKFLIEKGAKKDIDSDLKGIENNLNNILLDVDSYCDEDGNTALILACRKKKVKLASLLIKKNKGLINKPNNKGYTPSIVVHCNKNYKLLKLLLDNGAKNIENVNKFGNTTLLLACMKNNFDFARVLLEVCKRKKTFIKQVNRANKEKETPLFWACKYKNIDLIRLLIENGAEVDEKVVESYGNMLLNSACENNNDKLIELLLQNGVQVDAIDKEFIKKYGAKLLIFAIKTGNDDLAKKLVEKKVDVSVCDASGNSALFLALKSKNIELVNTIIKNCTGIKENINKVNKFGETALLLACEMNNFKLVKSFVKAGADVNIVPNEKYMPLIIACKKGNYVIFRYLIQKGIKIDLENKEFVKKCKNLLLYFYVDAGDEKHIKQLMGERLDSSSDKLLISLLERACKKKKHQLVKMFLRKDISIVINKKMLEKYGNILLLSACAIDSHGLAKKLIDDKVKVDIEDNIENTPLILACKNNNFELVKDIVSVCKESKYINKKNKNGDTALIWATRNNNFNLVKYIIDNDGQKSINKKNKKKKTPFVIACDKGNYEIAKYMLIKRAKPDLNNNGIMLSCGKFVLLYILEKNKKSFFNIIREIINKSSDLSFVHNNKTALERACNAKNYEIAELFLEKGAQVDEKILKSCKQELLFSACAANKIAIVKECIKNKARINEQNLFGKTALDIAIDKGHGKIKKFLIMQGAKKSEDLKKNKK